MPILTLADIKTHLSVPNASEDVILQSIVDASDSYVASYCDRIFDEATYTEYLDGPGKTKITLEQYPVTAITEINYDPSGVFGADTVLDSTEYTFTSGGEVIFRYTAPKGHKALKVIYTAGYTTIPTDLNRAGVLLAEFWYRHRARGEIGVSSKTKQQEIVNYSKAGIPPEVEVLLNRYRRLDFGSNISAWG